MPLLPTGAVSIGVIAGQRCRSRQTLFRKLTDEGVTFEPVLDKRRHTLARNCLKVNKTSVICHLETGCHIPASCPVCEFCIRTLPERIVANLNTLSRLGGTRKTASEGRLIKQLILVTGATGNIGRPPDPRTGQHRSRDTHGIKRFAAQNGVQYIVRISGEPGIITNIGGRPQSPSSCT